MVNRIHFFRALSFDVVPGGTAVAELADTRRNALSRHSNGDDLVSTANKSLAPAVNANREVELSCGQRVRNRKVFSALSLLPFRVKFG